MSFFLAQKRTTIPLTINAGVEKSRQKGLEPRPQASRHAHQTTPAKKGGCCKWHAAYLITTNMEEYPSLSHLFFQRKPSANLYACQYQFSCI
jgi:hypothetical protein